MECNRDEAVKAREIAESKFKAKDIEGAIKFALKAQKLFPELEGISQMLATFDVHLAAKKKVNGETDWYAVLNVSTTADDETVKKQYRKLALSLHPDKNKSIGADGAFKFLSEAWIMLSDKSRRMAYDQKRNVVVPHQQVPQPNRHQSVPNSNGNRDFTKAATPNIGPPKVPVKPAPSAATAILSPSKPRTFWTTCPRCKMQYEYLRLYLNHKLICPNCHDGFLAVDTGIPPKAMNTSTSQKKVNHELAKKSTYLPGRNSPAVPNLGNAGYLHGTSNPFNCMNFQWGPYSRTASAATLSSAATQTMKVVNPVHEKIQKHHEATLNLKNYASKRVHSASSAGNSNSSNGTKVEQVHPSSTLDRFAKKRRVLDDDSGCKSAVNPAEQELTGNGRSYKGVKVPTTTETEASSGLPGALDIRQMLMEKARTGIRKKLKEWNLDAAKAAVKDREKAVECEKHKPNEYISKKKSILEKESLGNQGADQEKEKSEPVLINVPDPDFHDFDQDRSEKTFNENQVWAAYDDDDGMPRFYAIIHKIISLRPFKMRFSWLNSKTNGELGPINWVSSGFYKSCGEFRVGRYEIGRIVNVFSHRVKWEKGARGVVRIFPTIGEVWALYRNWSPDWNENTPDEVVHKYDMVEVIDDYSEAQGISVAPLVKVAGFKTVFHRHKDPTHVRRFPREEMFRFSHKVPSWMLTGKDAKNAPEGCTELDPAATPLELLNVISEMEDGAV